MALLHRRYTMTTDKMRAFSMTIPWNLFLLSICAILTSAVLCTIAKPHAFVSSGFYGLSLLINYAVPELSLIGIIYAIINVPAIILGMKLLSRRFVLYSLYCIAATTVTTELIPWVPLGIEDKMLAAVATGIGCGAASGFALRSLGSDGGINIIGLILFDKYNISVGTVSTVFNALLFLAATPVISIDNVLYSMIIAFLASAVMNYSMTVFSKRKVILIISEQFQQIYQSILHKTGRGCTILYGEGAYTSTPKKVLLTAVHDMQLKRVEKIIYDEDPQAMVIVMQSNMVYGKGFSSRKVY